MEETMWTVRNAAGLISSIILIISILAAWMLGVSSKIIGIGITAYAVMSIGGLFGYFIKESLEPFLPTIGYSIASGMMISSAGVFLIPQATNLDGTFGGIGIAVGIFLGYFIHILSHSVTHMDIKSDIIPLELTIHSAFGGIVIGFIYTALPSISAILGLSLISHKLPAGYISVRDLDKKSVLILLLPASIVGIAAIAVGLSPINISEAGEGFLSGIGAGIFLHAAIDILPECTVGSDICDYSKVSHRRRDRLRKYAALGTIFGFSLVVGSWWFFLIA